MFLLSRYYPRGLVSASRYLKMTSKLLLSQICGSLTFKGLELGKFTDYEKILQVSTVFTPTETHNTSKGLRHFSGVIQYMNVKTSTSK